MTQPPNSPLHGGAPEPEGINLEPSPFEVGYQPESLPRFSMPDLPEDAPGLSAEALAKVPTLTELVMDVAAEPVPPMAQIEAEPTQLLAQDLLIQADLWNEEVQARMGKLTEDIQILNVRLDRLEELNKAKV